MHLKHLNLCVADVPIAQAFFERYFAFRFVQVQQESGHVVLEGADGFALVLSPADTMSPPVYPGRFHIGFIVSNHDALMAMYEKMLAEGVEVVREPETFGFGTAFYAKTPGGIVFEITALAPAAN